MKRFSEYKNPAHYLILLLHADNELSYDGPLTGPLTRTRFNRSNCVRFSGIRIVLQIIELKEMSVFRSSKGSPGPENRIIKTQIEPGTCRCAEFCKSCVQWGRLFPSRLSLCQDCFPLDNTDRVSEIPTQAPTTAISAEVNEDCGLIHEETVATQDLHILSQNMLPVHVS